MKRSLKLIDRHGAGHEQHFKLRLVMAATALLVANSVADAQVHRVIKSFGIRANIIGLEPRSGLTQAPDGNLYGTTSRGDGYGTIFKVNSNGTDFTVLKWFGDPLE